LLSLLAPLRCRLLALPPVLPNSRVLALLLLSNVFKSDVRVVRSWILPAYQCRSLGNNALAAPPVVLKWVLAAPPVVPKWAAPRAKWALAAPRVVPKWGLQLRVYLKGGKHHLLRDVSVKHSYDVNASIVHGSVQHSSKKLILLVVNK